VPGRHAEAAAVEETTVRKRHGWFALFAAVSALAGSPPAPRIVATIFPLYDWTREIVGPDGHAVQLLPAGVEIHSWAPAPSDLAAIQTAELFVWAGPHLEPWAERLVQSTRTNTARFEAAAHLPSDFAPPGDPHFWTDPLAAISVVRALTEVLAQQVPAHAESYRQRARAYVERIAELHQDLDRLVRGARRRTIVFAGHRAFEPMARRYGLTFVTPIAALSPEVPPTPRAMADLVRAVRESGARAVFHEEIIEPRMARVVAAECGEPLRLLHGLHNRTPEEAARGETWLSLYRRNLEALREELGSP